MKAYEETDALRPTQVEGVPLAHLVKALERTSLPCWRPESNGCKC